jgi:DUF3040 family protein
MSLKPSEQKALAEIEQALRNSDKRLAATLEAFTRLTTNGRAPRWRWLWPWRLRLGRHRRLPRTQLPARRRS